MGKQSILIRGGLVIDGTAAPGKVADLLIEGDHVTAIGNLEAAQASRTIDATGRVVAPGFVDPHNHADNEVQGGILAHPLADNLVRQGITTAVCNQCGGATLPVGAFLEEIDRVRPAVNIAMLSSQSCARREAMSKAGADRPGPEVWSIMSDLIREDMENGALGVSSGILGLTQAELPTEELIEAARAVAPYGGVYASHIRDEGETNRHLEAIEEVHTIVRRSGARGQVSHLKLWGTDNWGQTDEVLAIFDSAKREGLVMAADQYPYVGGYRGLYSLLWDCNRADPTAAGWRERALTEVRRQFDIIGGPDHVVISSHEHDDPLDGKTAEEAGRVLGVDPEEAVLELFFREPRPRLSAFFLAMREEDVRVFMLSEHTMAGTDSHVRLAGSGAAHPRCFGTYPRLLGKYVREEKLIPLERMVHRMTGAVVEQFGIAERGLLRPGMYADVVIFDPETVRDRATWQDGYRYSVGIEWVIVNGGVAVAPGEVSVKGFGRAVRRRSGRR